METPIPTIRAILEATPARWRALAALPSAVLDREPAPGAWSARSCLGHLLATERHVFPSRVRALLEGRDFDAYDPDAAGDKDTAGEPAELVAEFTALRSGALALLDTVQPEDLTRTAIHAELGRVSLGELLHEWAAHDLNHTIQAEHALMQPFIAGCGPWRHYFAAHDARARPGA